MCIDNAAEQPVTHRQVQTAVLAAPPWVVFSAEAGRRVRRWQRLQAAREGVPLAPEDEELLRLWYGASVVGEGARGGGEGDQGRVAPLGAAAAAAAAAEEEEEEG